jgi:L-cysteine desulfidase
MVYRSEDLVKVLKKEMIPALGVTEIGAIALACSKAYRAIGGNLQNINIVTDPGIFKNGFSCVVPGTREIGNEIAAILGVLVGVPELELEVLRNVKSGDIIKAKKLRDEGIAKVGVKRGIKEIFIDATVTTNKGVGRAVIKRRHTNIVLIEVNGEIQYNSEKEEKEREKESTLKNFKLTDFVRFVNEVPFNDIKFTLEAVKMNKELGQAGMKKAGMGVGIALSKLIKEHKISDDIRSYAQILAAFAVDARMGGVQKPAMSISGSGDHGIIASMPLAAVAERMGIGEEKLARAIALTYLVTIYIKEYSGKLSAFCGCAVAGGTGASAGITYLLGGNEKQIEYAINNMAANITGMICDGGNFGCALKAITGAGTAVISAFFAIENIVIPKGSGIVGKTVQETMMSIGKIASPGMTQTDDVILDIMLARSK